MDPGWQAPTFEPWAGTMSTNLDDWEARLPRRRPFSISDARAVLSGQATPPPRCWSMPRLLEVLASTNAPIHIKRTYCKSNSRHCAGRLTWGVWMHKTTSSGVKLATLRCLACGLEIETIGANKMPDPLPAWSDGTSAEACERCGTRSGVELHHWAPHHLFSDADDWPTAWLCRTCHQLWHRVVTPDMSKQRKGAA